MPPSAEGGSAKRVKATAGPSHAVRRPRLFQPFRALGLVTDNVPFVLTVRHGGKDAVKPDIYIFTCIRNSWMMWDADRMTLLFVGEPINTDINALLIVSGSSGRDSVLAASGRRVCRFVRGRLVDTFTAEEDDGQELNSGVVKDTSDLSHILAVGDNLLAVSSSGHIAYVWSLSQHTLLRHITLDRHVLGTDDIFEASSILHPSTYVDKVLLGSRQGHLQLYNFRTSTLLHTFTRSSLLAYMGLADALIEPGESCAGVEVVETPAIYVVAVVFEAGYVLLLDIRYDEPVLYARVARGTVSQGNILGRSSVTFRTDGLAHTMAVGTRLGDIVLFDLESSAAASHNERQARPAQLAHTIRTAHDGPIASVQFLQGQPLLISSGGDNAIKQWFFETNSVTGAGELGGSSFGAGLTAPPRLLKSREGHSAPPRLIRYIGDGGRTIISAGGEDRSVRAISVVRDSRSAELSQGSVQKKAKQIARPLISLKLQAATSIAHSSTRTRDWDDLITTHQDTSYAQSWTTRDQRIGSHKLRSTFGSKKVEQSTASVAQISVCGNFAMVGNSFGYVEMFNVQSGRYQRRFDTRDQKLEKVAKRLKGGVVQWKEEKVPVQGSSITGIVSDSINKTVAISTAQGTLHFFDFHTGQETDRVPLRSGARAILLHRASNLVAVVHEDHTIALFDIETYKMVRLFSGFGDTILDITFSPDGRWLIASCLDGFVRTYDIPTSRLVDYFYTKQPAVSLSFSPLGNFLATAHEGSRGIYLWANRNQYLNLALSGIDEEEVISAKEGQEALPTLRGIDLDALAEEDAQLKELDVGEAQYQRTYTSEPQLFVSDGRTGGPSRESDGLLTLSTMPRSRWMTLLNLDMIKARNKPKEAPKKPEKAPFFLPMAASSVPDSAIDKGGAGAWALGQEDEDGGERVSSKRLQLIASGALDIESHFSRRLAGALQDDQMDALFLYLNALSPPALDSEIRSLVRVQDVTRFLQCMTRRLQQHLDYDAVQAMTSVALRVHGDLIVENGVKASDDATSAADDSMDVEKGEDDAEGRELTEAMRNLMAEQYREGNRLLDLVQYCMGSLAFVRDMPLA